MREVPNLQRYAWLAAVVVTIGACLGMSRAITLASGPAIEQRNDFLGEVERLLAIVEDTNLPARERVSALRDMRKHLDFICICMPEAVPRLAELLPGEGDALTREVVVLLADIGDDRAVPKLREMLESGEVGQGNLGAALVCALRDLDPAIFQPQGIEPIAQEEPASPPPASRPRERREYGTSTP